MDDLWSRLRNKAEDIHVLKSFWNLYFSFQFSGKLIFVAPSYHKFSIYLLLLWTVSQDFCAQGECNIALSDTTEKKTNIFAAVNKPTYFKKKNFFVFKKRNYFNFGIQAAAPE